MDDFNLMPMLNNLLFALDASSPHTGAAPLPFAGPAFQRWFPVAGLWVVNTPVYYAVVGVSKGGTVSVFDKAAARLTARHSGFILQAAGATFTSQEHRPAPTVTWNTDQTVVSFDVPWKSLRTTVFGSWLFLAFRLFTLTLGRAAVVSRSVKALLVHALIRRKQPLRVRHARTLRVLAGRDRDQRHADRRSRRR